MVQSNQRRHDEIRRKAHNLPFCCSLSLLSYSGWVSTEHRSLLVHTREEPKAQESNSQQENWPPYFYSCSELCAQPLFQHKPTSVICARPAVTTKANSATSTSLIDLELAFTHMKKKSQMQTDGPKNPLSHRLVNLNNANKNGVNLHQYFKRA